MGDQRIIVTGPNHALHFVLTLLTFWAFGGWAWVWLVVALQNRRRVVEIDEHGNRIGQYDRLGAVFVDDDGQWRWLNLGLIAAALVAVFLIAAAVNL